MRIPIAVYFRDIFMEIGDNQSIEDDLSTYSSHLRDMKEILAKGSDKSLVLIDEFGTGTEPQIGGAIAQAVLEQFHEKGMWGSDHHPLPESQTLC